MGGVYDAIEFANAMLFKENILRAHDVGSAMGNTLTGLCLCRFRTKFRALQLSLVSPGFFVAKPPAHLLTPLRLGRSFDLDSSSLPGAPRAYSGVRYS